MYPVCIPTRGNCSLSTTFHEVKLRKIFPVCLERRMSSAVLSNVLSRALFFFPSRDVWIVFYPVIEMCDCRGCSRTDIALQYQSPLYLPLDFKVGLDSPRCGILCWIDLQLSGFWCTMFSFALWEPTDIQLSLYNATDIVFIDLNQLGMFPWKNGFLTHMFIQNMS